MSDVDISRRTGLSPRSCEVSADSVRYLYVDFVGGELPMVEPRIRPYGKEVDCHA
jgi:hypothetical protein